MQLSGRCERVVKSNQYCHSDYGLLFNDSCCFVGYLCHISFPIPHSRIKSSWPLFIVSYYTVCERSYGAVALKLYSLILNELIYSSINSTWVWQFSVGVCALAEIDDAICVHSQGPFAILFFFFFFFLYDCCVTVLWFFCCYTSH